MGKEPWVDISREINKILLVHEENYYELRDVNLDILKSADCFLTYQKSFVKKFYIKERIVDQNNNLILIAKNVQVSTL